MARASSRQVVQELKEDNRLGCHHLIELYQDRLIEEATNVFHVPFMDAEEIASDVLLAVVKKIDGFEFKKSDADFHYWLMKIFRNRVRDFMRHQAFTDGFMESFGESLLESDEAFSPTEREILATVMQNYQTSVSPSGHPDSESEGSQPSKRLQIIADMLDEMETWERVLLRCRALDVPYVDIARYTGKTAKQLKVYHARVKKKLMKLLVERYPEYFKL